MLHVFHTSPFEAASLQHYVENVGLCYLRQVAENVCPLTLRSVQKYERTAGEYEDKMCHVEDTPRHMPRSYGLISLVFCVNVDYFEGDSE